MNGSATLEHQLIAERRITHQLHCQSQVIILFGDIQRIFERFAVDEVQLLFADHG